MKDAGPGLRPRLCCAQFILRPPELFVKQVIVDDRVQTLRGLNKSTSVVGLFPAPCISIVPPQ